MVKMSDDTEEYVDDADVYDDPDPDDSVEEPSVEEDDDPVEELSEDFPVSGQRNMDIKVDGVHVKIRKGKKVKHPLPVDLLGKLLDADIVKAID
jgi:hypothetical protein